MSGPIQSNREGSLEAPTRHALDWQNPAFYEEAPLMDELERVFDFEIDGVDRKDYWSVVDECFMCDLCYQTKCPYIPPHEWNIDFPHLMLQAKAIQFKKGERKISHKLISNTGLTGTVGSIPVISQTINAANRNKPMRKLLEKALDIHPDAHLPEYHTDTIRKRDKDRSPVFLEPVEAAPTRGKAALFTTCYCNVNEPDIGSDLISIFEHNGIPVTLTSKEACCGMPKLEQGDLETVDKYKKKNIPELVRLIDEGWDIIAAIPSCVLMFKQELPLMYPDDADVQKVKQHIFDPFEYLLHRHKAGLLNTEFKNPIGTVAWHVPCHQRVQKIGPKTKEVLSLVPDSEIHAIERCSGHDGTYGVRKGTYAKSKKIARAVVNRVKKTEADYLVSDCPMAATQIADELELKNGETSPIRLLRHAYGI
jgi:Fe-S oxidoreductase